jgi:hypothetical protein
MLAIPNIQHLQFPSLIWEINDSPIVWLINWIDRFQTYFPHVDNVYSHRSTQRYKRRPFVSHYWDCRLKGRPPGTPKSDDPNKKKRKRTARERDLCDVKIKITEYLPGAATVDRAGGFESLPADLLPGRHTLFPVQGDQPFGVLAPSPSLAPSPPGTGNRRYYTIQRVNGNGANGKNDGVSGGHRHSIEESDRVKKNSVQRYLLKDKGKKKSSVRLSFSTVYGVRCVGYSKLGAWHPANLVYVTVDIWCFLMPLLSMHTTES